MRFSTAKVDPLAPTGLSIRALPGELSLFPHFERISKAELSGLRPEIINYRAISLCIICPKDKTSRRSTHASMCINFAFRRKFDIYRTYSPNFTAKGGIFSDCLASGETKIGRDFRPKFVESGSQGRLSPSLLGI